MIAALTITGLRVRLGATLLGAASLAIVLVHPVRADNLAMDCKALSSQADAVACDNVRELLRDLARGKANSPPEHRTLPIALKCPAGSGEALEFVQKSPSGRQTRTRVTFDGEVPVFLEGEAFAPERQQWISIIKGKIADLTDPAYANTVRGNIALMSRLRARVCLAPSAVREAFLKGLEANKASFQDR